MANKQIILEDLPYEDRLKYIEEMRKINLAKNKPEFTYYGYRCEQNNITKIEEIPTFNAHTKMEYHLGINGLYGNLRMTDFFCEFSMAELNGVVNSLKKIEFIKNNIFFEIDKNEGVISKVLNKKELCDNWNEYKKNELLTDPYIEKMTKRNSNLLDEIIQAGNLQFSKDYPLVKEYDKILFHHILFNKYLVTDIHNLKNDVYYTNSQLFRDINLKIDIVYKVVKNDDLITIKQKGVVDKRVLNMKGIEDRYNANYKPLIKYSFTDFDLEYNVIFKIDPNINIIHSAEASIIETVKNNCQNITSFNLKKIEL